MVRYPPDRHVVVAPHTRQPSAAGVLVGRPELATFVLLPAEALEVLDDLAAGLTVGQAQQSYHARHGEVPEMDEFLSGLEKRGLVRPAGLDGVSAGSDATEAVPAIIAAPARRQFHFEWISPAAARRLCSPAVLAAGGIVVLLAALAAAREPAVLPGWRAAYFPKDTARGLLFLMCFGVLTTFFHEMGHLLAARARGVSCRLGLGNQMWFVVWETDMTGVWALPARERYLPILAGPLVDVVSASLLVLVSFGHLRGWWALSPRALQYGRAVLLLYLLRLLWQCYFFLRTDFYYAISNFLGCTSLMRDTRVWLRDVLARRLGLGKAQDQSDLPARERRMVRVYAVVWLAGRSLAIATLLLVQLPLLVQYAMLLGRTLGGQAAPAAAETAPRLLAGLFFTTLLLTGFGLWLRQLWLGRGETA